MTWSVAAHPVLALKTWRSSASDQVCEQILVMGRKSARVAVVEDEEPVRLAVERALRREGVSVVGFADYAEPELILAFAPDLAVLDVGLPGGDGFEFAGRLRADRDVPVIFLTARDTVEDRLRGFALGADDYLVKPFSLEELLARLCAVLRRTGRLDTVIEAGDVIIDEP